MKKKVLECGQWPTLLALFVLLLLIVACSGTEETTWLNAPGWRRAMLVGNTLAADPVSVALDDQGGMSLLFVADEGGAARLHVKHFDRSLALVWERNVQEAQRRIMQPQIIWDGQRLHLFWIDDSRLYSTTMNAAGNETGAAHLLSAEQTVDSYDVAIRSSQQVSVWFGGSPREPGVFAVNDAAATIEIVSVDDQGIKPRLRVDAEGGLHAVWLRHAAGTTSPSFYYAVYAPGQSANQEQPGTLIATARVGLTSVLEGPSLGVDDEHAYVFWSTEVRTGPQAGAAETSYVTFPLGRSVGISGPQTLTVPADSNLEYQSDIESPLQSGPRVLLPAGDSRTVPLDLEANTEPASELVVATQVTAAHELRKVARQSALIYFRDGQPLSYQLLSFTRSGTSLPFVRSDGEGYLYATWQEPAAERGYLTYLSSTAPEASATLASVSLNDISRIVTELLFGMLSGAVLSPFAGILWLIAPLFVLGITGFMRRESESGISIGSAVSLVLALAAFWFVKTATLPGVRDYVPFSPWIPFIPPWLGVLLQWGVMLLILLVALFTAWHFTYRRNAPSALNFMLIYTAVDSVLSMAVYGSIIYGYI